MKKFGAAAILALSMSVMGGAGAVATEPLCEDTQLTVQIPQPNPYDDVPAGSLPEPTGVGFEVTLRQVNGLSVADFNPKMPPDDARAMGLGEPVSALSDANAQAVFTGLPEGVYVVSTKAPDNPAYRKAYIDDFLVSIPVGGNCIGEVAAKIHYTPTPTPSVPPTPTPTPTKPPGDLSRTGAQVAGIGIAGLALIGAGGVLLASRRRHENSSSEGRDDRAVQG